VKSRGAVVAGTAEDSAGDTSVVQAAGSHPVALAIAVVVIATGVAAAVVTIGVRATPKSRAFSDHIEYITWATLAIGLVAVAVTGAVFSVPAWRDLHARSGWPARFISYGVGLLITLCYDASPGIVVRLLMQRGSAPLYGSLFREIALGVMVVTELEPIVLERGVTHDASFELWANKVWPRPRRQRVRNRSRISVRTFALGC
jgi:hypothetical protein